MILKKSQLKRLISECVNRILAQTLNEKSYREYQNTNDYKVKVDWWSEENPYNNTFVAIDTEFSCAKQYICQLSAVKVNDGEIIDEKNWLIMPVNGEIEWRYQNMHKISNEMVKDSPTFDKIYDEFIDFIGDNDLVFHNATADLYSIAKTCDYYDLPWSRDNKIIDTYKLFPYRLNIVCDLLGIDMGRHHDAMNDARGAAMVYLAYLKGEQIDYDTADFLKSEESHLKQPNTFSRNSQTKKSKSLPQLSLDSVDDPKNFFFNKKVVYTGVFSHMSREELGETLQSLGAKVNSSISSKTDYVIMGEDAGPAKQTKIKDLQSKGVPIKVITEDELMFILNKGDLEIGVNDSDEDDSLFSINP